MEKQSFSPANTTLVVVNTLIYLYMILTGDPSDLNYMYAHGAMVSDPEILNGEYWRMISCAFLHFDNSHIFNNMIMLLFLGVYVERAFGTLRYLLIYFFCAFSGSFVSYIAAMEGETLVVSGGASGAIFGIMGALLFVILYKKGRYEGLTMKRYLFMIVISLYYGFATAGVDNLAHVGGFIAGFLAGFLLFPRGFKRARDEGN
ncbi:MAG: rhomboid family intramembrane serine protease [Lachnospiraceae bacterium]|nr:rhomboid family intramembrane serine protease [Lachnospiraceae bacterium]